MDATQVCNLNNINDLNKGNSFPNFTNFYFNPMQNMMLNNFGNFSNLNMNYQMNNFAQNNQFFNYNSAPMPPINYNNFFMPNQAPNMNYNMMNMNNMMNNMANKMENIKLNDYCHNADDLNCQKNNINNIQPMLNTVNSMNNIQPNYCMNNSVNEMNIQNNMNNMNNMLNSVNIMNNNMNYYNNFNSMNNYFNNNFVNGDDNNLSNSFNNITIPKLSEEFSLCQNIDLNNESNTLKPFINDINIIFAFTTAESFTISCRLNEKLSTVINRFKDSQCPERLKDSLVNCLHNGAKLDLEKTLKESGINKGDRIVFISNISDNNEDKKEKENSNNNNNSLASLSSSGIIVKEHIHNLVYCLNNFSWKCNICKIKYEKKSPKYYCSICNFALCEKCHDIRNYPKKKEFPEGSLDADITIKKKFLKTVYHKHYLAYCRTSRDTDELKQWYCNNCKETFENDVWSFYCTKCDFDLCKKCAGYN